jgi:hypothetical protein
MDVLEEAMFEKQDSTCDSNGKQLVACGLLMW